MHLSKSHMMLQSLDVLDRKETVFDYKKNIFLSLKNLIFPKGLTHAFGEKM